LSQFIIRVTALLGRIAYALCRQTRYVANGRNKWANAIRPYRRQLRFVAIVPFWGDCFILDNRTILGDHKGRPYDFYIIFHPQFVWGNWPFILISLTNGTCFGK